MSKEGINHIFFLLRNISPLLIFQTNNYSVKLKHVDIRAGRKSHVFSVGGIFHSWFAGCLFWYGPVGLVVSVSPVGPVGSSGSVGSMGDRKTSCRERV